MLTTLFYRLPRLTALAVLLSLAAGIGALLTLGRQEDPTLVERYGYVLTTFPGADAERVEALITEPIERSLQELKELSEIDSTSRANVSQIGIEIREDLSAAEVDDAWTLIRQQVELARSNLPAGVSIPFVQRQYVGANTMVVSFTWEGESEPQMALMNRMARDLRDVFQNLPGTEETEIYGEVQEEIRVVLDPDRLAAMGLTAGQAAQIISRADSKTPAGQVRTSTSNLGLEVAGEFDSIGRIREIPLVQYPDGTAVRVSDISIIEKTERSPPDVLAQVGHTRAIMVGAFIEPNIRLDQWAETALAAVEEFKMTAPRGVSVDIVFNQSEYTNDRLGGLVKNFGFSALIVFLVLFFIMGWRAALIVGSALPLTVLLVLILMGVFGIPLHQMSITGLVISLGLLIDNAIVVTDEIEQKRAKGYSRLEAIDRSLKHLFGPLFASTLTTGLAFAPIALMPGGAGEFIGTLGLSVIFAVSSSFLVAVTVVSSFTGWFDRDRVEGEKRRWWRDGVAFDTLTDGYRWTIDVCLRFPVIGAALGIIPPVLGFMMAGTLPIQFFPQTERDQFQVDVLLPPEASIEETQRVVTEATDILLAYPMVENVYWTIGEGAPRVYYNAFNSSRGVAGIASGWVELESTQATRIVLPRIQQEIRDRFPTAQFLTLPYEQGPPIDAPIEFFITGPDLRMLNAIGEDARKILADTPGVTYTRASLNTGAPKINLRADEAAAELAGVRLTDLAGDLSAELDGVIAGSVLEGTEEIPVRVIAPAERRGDLSSLRDKRVGATPDNLGAPLSSLGEITLEPEISVITHKDGERVNTIQAFLEPYMLPASAFEAFQANMADAGFVLPAGYKMRFGGEAETRGNATGNLFGTAAPLIIVMAGCVALVFNSFRMAALVLLTGGLSIGLAFGGVWLFGLPLGFNAIVGAMGLLGISINGTIVVLSALRASPKSCAGDRDAQRETVVDATRHIVATTLTTIGGFTPLILSGDLFWLPLATAIAGGVAGSAILSLYFTPAMFAFGMSYRRQIAKWRGKRVTDLHSEMAPAE